MLRAAQAITTVNRWTFEATKWLVYVIAALMLFEVISRYSFSAPTSWGPELATLLFGPFFLMGGPYLLHTGGHVAAGALSALQKQGSDPESAAINRFFAARNRCRYHH